MVVRQVKLVDETRTGRIAESRQERVEELELFSNVVLVDIGKLFRRNPTPNGD